MSSVLWLRFWRLGSWHNGTAGGVVPATVAAIADAVRWAEEIMREIDGRWPDAKDGRRRA